MSKNTERLYLVNIPIVNQNGKPALDIDFFRIFLELIQDNQTKKDSDSEITYQNFKAYVAYLWKSCVTTKAKPWKDKNIIIGEALAVDYPFDPDKIAQHADEIHKLISMVHLATNYEEMKFLDSGEKWSELRQPVSMLMALGNALHLVDFKNNRADWDLEEERNPEIKFTLK